MNKIRHLPFSIRLINKAVRLSAETKSILAFGCFEGLLGAYHVKEEIKALRKANWASLRKHYLCRFDKNKRYKEFFLKLADFVNTGTEEKKTSPLKNALNPLIKKLSYSECWSLYEYFRYFGDFRIAYYLRKSLLKRSIDKQMTSKFIFSLDGINAAFELGFTDEISEILTKKTLSPFISSKLDEANAYFALLNGDIDKAHKIWSKTFDKNDLKYLDMLKGCDVAVVGPAASDLDLGQEIDQSDCVIRTNYRVGSNQPYEMFGKRTDVAYYNQYRINQKWDETSRALNGLEWVIAKSQKDELKVRKLKKQINVRSSFVPHTNFFQTSAPMGIIVALGDILRFQPSNIKVYSTSFYCSKQTYSQNYKSTDTSRALASSDIRIHEPFSQFAYAKHLFNRNIISADSLTSDVLKIDGNEYSKSLQTLYGGYSVV